MSQCYNFSPGPATLPTAVREQIHAAWLDWQGLGCSVAEVSHRSRHFREFVVEPAVATLRRLLCVPDDYAILFLQGGARTQFAMVPMNCGPRETVVDYLNTGLWSTLAIREAERFRPVGVAFDLETGGYDGLADPTTWRGSPEAYYLHYTANETITGVEFPSDPPGDVPLVSDMSSNMLSRPIDFARHHLVYAAAQKNLGIAGVTIVIVKPDWLAPPASDLPNMLTYANHIREQSLYNTAPTFNWYVSHLVFQWIEAQGGVAVMQQRSQAKAQKIYTVIDASDFYINTVPPAFRSCMNVTFTLRNAERLEAFLEQAAAAGLANLKGHRAVGGCRASLYLGMPEAGAEALAAFMRDFEQRHG